MKPGEMPTEGDIVCMHVEIQSCMVEMIERNLGDQSLMLICTFDALEVHFNISDFISSWATFCLSIKTTCNQNIRIQK